MRSAAGPGRERTGSETRIPVLLCVDVEPDQVEVSRDRPQPWFGFERMLGYIRELRPRLAEATGAAVRLNWFLRMDPQVAQSYGSARWVADTYRSALTELRAAGDTLGLHPHAWRWQESTGRWLADHGNPGWVEECMRTAFDAYAGAFGEPCVAHRFGDRFMSAAVVRVLRELGVRYDLTVEPGARATRSIHPGTAVTGRIPDHGPAPREPYHPAAEDPMRPASRSGPGRQEDLLWMIPLTAIDRDPLLPIWRRVARRIRHPDRPRHRPAQLWAPAEPGRFWRIVEDHVVSSPRPYVALAVRSDIPLRSPFMAAVEAKLESLLSDPFARRLEFTTPGDTLARLAANG